MVCCVIGCPNHSRGNSRRGASEKTTFHMFPNPNHHQYRMQQWLDACNNPKIRHRDPMLVYKQYRMCRLHFATDCFNGACKRLLETAIPTLRLNLETPKAKGSPAELRENDLIFHGKPEDQTIDETIEYETEYLENAMAIAAPTIMEDWHTDQRLSKDESIDIEMKAMDDENINSETQKYIELYEQDVLFEAEDGKHDDSKTWGNIYWKIEFF